MNKDKAHKGETLPLDTLHLVVEGSDGRVAAALPLPEGEFFIGKGDDCHLVLRGKRISNRHVLIDKEKELVVFRDCGTTLGLSINGEPTREGSLEPGDRLTVGSCTLFTTRDNPFPEPDETKERGSRIDWSAFRAFVEGIRSLKNPKELLEQLLLGLVDLLNGERGFVILGERPGKDVVPVASHGISDAHLRISRTVYKRALQTGATVLVADTLTDPWYLSATSLSLDGTSRSILCGPLQSGGATYGAIYVDGASALDESHVPFFETVTDLASELLAATNVRQRLQEASERLDALHDASLPEGDFVTGKSELSRVLQSHIHAAASQDVNVLLSGETGTGKETVARAIHRLSTRRDGPFVAVSCAALPEGLIEAELFGAEAGAYTGAVDRRLGRFELAHGGTLFLDEVSELSIEVQVKLLRVLQERRVTRLGGNAPVAVDFRLLCASNRDLEVAVAQKTMRADFYYRICVLPLELPPLRKRPEDVIALARHFCTLFASRFRRQVEGLSPEAEALLKRLPWPGNVRELRNAIERAVLVESGKQIHPANLPHATATDTPPSQGGVFASMPARYDEARARFERSFFEGALARAKGDVTLAATEMGISRSGLYAKLGKLGMLKK